MITAARLPHSGIGVESINKDRTTPFFSEIFYKNNHYYIHNDGSLVSFYEISEISASFFKTVIDNMIAGSSIQIYKVKKESVVTNYLCIKLPIETKSLKLKFLSTFSHLFKGTDSLVEELNTETISMSNIACMLTGSFAVNLKIDCNILYTYLMDCSTNNSIYPSPDVNMKSNMSVILTGENRCSCLYSLNDYRNLNLSTKNLLNGFDSYLQYLSIHKPSENQVKTIENTFSENTNLIAHLSPEEPDDARVHTMGLESAQEYLEEIKLGLYFVSSAFIFNAGSVLDLDNISNNFSNTLSHVSIIPYLHTNSAALHYLSCFPGNANFGYHYQIAYCNFTRQLIHRYFEL